MAGMRTEYACEAIRVGRASALAARALRGAFASAGPRESPLGRLALESESELAATAVRMLDCHGQIFAARDLAPGAAAVATTITLAGDARAADQFGDTEDRRGESRLGTPRVRPALAGNPRNIEQRVLGPLRRALRLVVVARPAGGPPHGLAARNVDYVRTGALRAVGARAAGLARAAHAIALTRAAVGRAGRAVLVGVTLAPATPLRAVLGAPAHLLTGLAQLVATNGALSAVCWAMPARLERLTPADSVSTGVAVALPAIFGAPVTGLEFAAIAVAAGRAGPAVALTLTLTLTLTLAFTFTLGTPVVPGVLARGGGATPARQEQDNSDQYSPHARLRWALTDARPLRLHVLGTRLSEAHLHLDFGAAKLPRSFSGDSRSSPAVAAIRPSRARLESQNPIVLDTPSERFQASSGRNPVGGGRADRRAGARDWD